MLVLVRAAWHKYSDDFPFAYDSYDEDTIVWEDADRKRDADKKRDDHKRFVKYSREIYNNPDNNRLGGSS